MSENLNATNEATVDTDESMSIPCVESLESIHGDKTDRDHAEDIIPSNCIDSLINISGSVDSCEEISECLVSTEKVPTNYEELEVKDIENLVEDKLINVSSENILNQMDVVGSGITDNESILDVQNEIMETSNVVEVNTVDTDQKIYDNETGK